MQPSSDPRLSLLCTSLVLICQLPLGLSSEIVDDANRYSPETGCIQGFTKGKENCYQVFPDKLMWDQAEDLCTLFGSSGHLASILDVEELHFLAKLIKKSKHKHVWIGFSDLDFDGNWEWTDSSPAAFKPWAEHPGVRRCAALFHVDGYMLFRAQDCNVKQGYICKHEPRSQPE